MLVEPALRFVNHLLTSEDWARARLKVFSGQLVRFELGTLGLVLEITPAGFLRTTQRSDPIAVTASLPADAPLRLLTERAALIAGARISGSAELAESLSFVLRNLRWDVESDLAEVVGDVAARRLTMGGRQFAQWQGEQLKNLALNVAEYFTEEAPTIARRQDVTAFCGDVREVEERLKRLEKRLGLFEGREVSKVREG